MDNIVNFFRQHWELCKVCDYDVYSQDLGWLYDLIPESELDKLNGEYTHQCIKLFEAILNGSTPTPVQLEAVSAMPNLLALFQEAKGCFLKYDNSWQAKNAERAGMCVEKATQITQLAAVVKHVSQEIRAEAIIDIGGGVGHLARELATQNPGVQIGVIERDEALVETGRGLTKGDSVTFVTKTVQKEVNFTELCGAQFKPRAVFTGLHCCGGFGVHLTVMFRATQGPAGFVQMPCCYQKISADYFLVSRRFQELREFLLSQKGFVLRSFLNVACVDFECNTTQSGTEIEQTALRKHRRLLFNRAFEKLRPRFGETFVAKRSRLPADDIEGYLWQQFDAMNHKGFHITKEEYARLLEELYGCPVERITHEYSAKRYNCLLNALFLLQTVCSRCFEALLLYDRLEYLREEPSIKAELIQICSCNTTPRNCCIIAVKNL